MLAMLVATDAAAEDEKHATRRDDEIRPALDGNINHVFILRPQTK